nr:immunoglobulin heavy chain junction region [Macaca mulatta]MOW76277.1 immunoglobulin heavy chain junction region [Macaca mulatta]MOW77230.1 immunoglobulin heavy chain junction region [Macaca mulatta]MOW78729.1 immunoglobulin heavy chain junction region [Macaca mulatta]MOW80389.1 immunoglobulin heavy chain junction region [Macaca mulatta]
CARDGVYSWNRPPIDYW